ncbi:plasmid encoded RepA protein (plasmid) [Rhodothermus marinus SG0.5JP17-172]|uniref:replication protein RepA n=1 Tax=Rhodothermus marinus TaxID=29549 RepID=UPI000223D52B|nr:replication protein RepA [Rhodothermus marinus]AEN74709.1 plasmid encoded RepA protein [Rhodothermus marinus SG0.5JP17-172]
MSRQLSLKRRVETIQEIRSVPAQMRGDVGYMAYVLVQTTLPHSDPGDVPAYGRSSGDLSLVVQPGYFLDRRGQLVCAGIPYGVYPRLILLWITTEVVRTRNRTLKLGNSLSEFMNELGLVPTGGQWGTISRLRDQMNRLFRARISISSVGPGKSLMQDITPVKSQRLWWDPKRPEEPLLFDSEITLHEDFYQMLVDRPVPVDVRVLKDLTRSPLAIDLYCWLTYRVSYLKHETAISWKQLQEQFGAEYSDTRAFARKARQVLKLIQVVWPSLRYATPKGRLVLYPCTPHVLKKTS